MFSEFPEAEKPTTKSPGETRAFSCLLIICEYSKSFAIAVRDAIWVVNEIALHSTPTLEPSRSKSVAKCSAVVALPPFPKHQIVVDALTLWPMATINFSIDASMFVSKP